MTTLNDHHEHRSQAMTDPTPDARAISETSSMIQAMRAEGERRVAAFQERMKTGAHPAWDGYPPNRQPGAHWLREKRQWDTAAVPGPTFLAEWSEVSDRWFYFGVSGSEDAAEIARRCDYLGPCEQPVAPKPDMLAGMIPCGSTVLWGSRQYFVPQSVSGSLFNSSRDTISTHRPAVAAEDRPSVLWDRGPR